jgi:hypothetical protein
MESTVDTLNKYPKARIKTMESAADTLNKYPKTRIIS